MYILIRWQGACSCLKVRLRLLTITMMESCIFKNRELLNLNFLTVLKLTTAANLLKIHAILAIFDSLNWVILLHVIPFPNPTDRFLSSKNTHFPNSLPSTCFWSCSFPTTYKSSTCASNYARFDCFAVGTL